MGDSERLLRVLFAELIAAGTPTVCEAKCHPCWPLVQVAWSGYSRQSLAALRDEDGVVAYVIEKGRILEPEDWVAEVATAMPDLAGSRAILFGEVTRNGLFGIPKSPPRSPWEIRAVPVAAKSPRLRRRSTAYGGDRTPTAR